MGYCRLTILLLLASFGGYVVGSIPTAWLVTRHILGKEADIRRLGDGNAGATNIGHLFGARWGVTVGTVDILKGFVVMSAFNLISRKLEYGEFEWTVTVPGMVAGAACVLGHIFPAWLGFRGGRGAAAAIGVAGAAYTIPFLLLTAPAALLLMVTRNTSIAFGTIYYWSLVVAKIFFDGEWGPIVYCWLLSYPVLLTDPRLTSRCYIPLWLWLRRQSLKLTGEK